MPEPLLTPCKDCAGCLAELLWPAREVERTALYINKILYDMPHSSSCRASVHGSGDNGISRLDHTRLAMDLASVSACRGASLPSVRVPDPLLIGSGNGLNSLSGRSCLLACL